MAKQTTRATRKRQPAKAAAQTAKKRSTTASAVSVRIRKTVAAKTSAKKAKRVGSKSVGKTAGKTGQGSVSVRMYRGLLGDFFLLQHTIGDRSFRMLIDCGVLQCIGKASAKPSTAGGKERIVAGVADFMRDTGGVLDLVVATHEHFDHLSGFIHAAEAFKDLTIRKVWMAWTEDRADKVANGYRNKKKKALTALTALVQNKAFAATSQMQAVSNLLQFYGDIQDDRSDAKGMAAAGSGKKLPGNASCEAVLEWLRVRAGAGNVSFLRPGEAVHWGLDDAFRAYVLGPPRDHDDLLRKLNPTPNAGEVYLARGEDVETVMGLAGIHGKHSGDTLVAVQPFTPLYQRAYDGKLGKSKHDVEMKKDSIVKLYRARQRFVRSIDTDWLGSAENLALKIDGDVNNTSLALALELSDKRVLLFPGDAQVGNWLSWGKQTYPESDGGRGRLKIEDILARTILYKVGHHASHNATLSKLGLELMTHVDLCAMVPVVERTAREQVTSRTPDGWGMPHDPLYVQLKKRTANRVIRGDGDVRSEKDKFDKAAFGLSYGPLFKPADPLWVQLTLAL